MDNTDRFFIALISFIVIVGGLAIIITVAQGDQRKEDRLVFKAYCFPDATIRRDENGKEVMLLKSGEIKEFPF